MTNNANPLEVPSRTICPPIVLERDQISTETSRFTELGPDVEVHNENVKREHGAAARLLEIADDTTLECGGSRFSPRPGLTFSLMDTLFKYPGSLVERKMLPLGAGYIHAMVNQINNSLDYRNPVVVTKDVEGSLFVHYGLAEDVILGDSRPKPESEEAVETNEPIPQQEQEAKEPVAEAKQVDLWEVVPDLLFPAQVNSASPERFLLISNIDRLNERTQWQLDEINKTRPPQMRVKPNRLTIIDDTHATFNGEDYDFGPFARGILNQLLANYLSPEMVRVRSLGIPADLRSGYDRASASKKAELFVHALKTRGIVFVKPDRFGGLVTLRPTIIRELRGGRQESQDQADGKHRDIITT